MAGVGNLDFLKGMALESAQLAVSYVKGEGETLLMVAKPPTLRR
jgi:hypothetical protein